MHKCYYCHEEFEIVTESMTLPIVCPFCGSDLDEEDEEEFDEEFDDDCEVEDE